MDEDLLAMLGFGSGPSPENVARMQAAALRKPAFAGGATGSWGEPQAPSPLPQVQSPAMGPSGPAPMRQLPKAVGGIKTKSTSSTSQPVTPPPSETSTNPVEDGMAGRQSRLENELAGLQAPVDYSSLKGESQRRQGESTNSLVMALAAQNAGKGFEPFAAQYLKQSTAQRAPMQVEGGYINEQGDAVIDPAFKRQQQIAQAQRRLDAVQSAIQSARSEAEKLAYKKHFDEANLDLRRAQMEMTNTIAQGNLDMRRQMAADKRDAVGGAALGFDALPKAATTKEKDSYGTAVAGLEMLPSLMTQVRANPNAFGPRVAAAEKIGGAFGVGQSDVPLVGKDLSPKEAQVRGQVFQRYASIINDMVGAAQTEGEITRLRPFIPLPGESAEAIARKMEGAKAEFKAAHDTLRSRYGMAPARQEPTTPATPKASGAWSVIEVKP